MKKVTKAVVLAMVLVPVAFLGGCNKKCNKESGTHHKYEQMKKEYGGK